MQRTECVARVFSAIGCFAIGVSCADQSAPRSPAPFVSLVSVAVNPTNALSLIVSVTAENVDSVRVRYAGDTASATPFQRVNSSGATTVDIVGLRASTNYSLVVEALGRNARIESEPQSAATGDLPPAIRSLRLAGSGRPSSGFTLVVPLFSDTTQSADGYVVAFDDAGEVRWYHRFPGAWPVEAKQQKNGHITVFVGRSYGWQPSQGFYAELTPGGGVVRAFSASAGYFTDPHELLLSFRDTTVVESHLFGYEIRSFDLSSIGGSSSAPLAVHTIERRSAAGAVLFRWSAASAFTPSDWPLPNQHAVDLVHPSSLAIAPDGGYVVSLQGMDEITKIDSASGALIWRLGGRHSQFEIRNDPLQGFLGQHNVQVLSNGNVLMMDDHFRGAPAPARAVEYALDTQTMVARMVWQYQPSVSVISPIMGSVQRLRSGATLVGFGSAGRVDEVAASGDVVWSATLRTDVQATLPFYRAVRLRSLYAYAPP
jgi:hypothetical protein